MNIKKQKQHPDMKRVNTAAVLLLFLLIMSSCFNENRKTDRQSFFPAKNLEEEGFDVLRLQKIDTFIQSYINRDILPNTVTFVARHGKIVHNNIYGWKDKEAGITLQKTDIFRLASQTKAITSVALLILYERGYFLLDDPLSKYIPEFKNPQVLVSLNLKDTTWTSRPAKSEILIRQLLNHTSGLTQGIRPDYPIYKKYGIMDARATEGMTLKRLIPVLARLPLVHDPGEDFSYGLSTDVIGYLIEVLSGKDLNSFLKSEIFDQLGMIDTYFYLPDGKKDRLVKLYEKPFADSALKPCHLRNMDRFPVEGPATYFSGAGGLCGTIEDYARFCQMLLNGGEFNGKRIISRKTIEMMTRNQIGDLQIWNGDKFGFGFEIMGNGSLQNLLGSAGSYRWAGMYSTDYMIDPLEDLIILTFTNVYPNVHFDEFTQRFRNIVYQALK
jgi:CubicO group peptidase (beta-lactamase class C family)